MANNELKRPRQESSNQQQPAPALKRRRRQRHVLSKKHGSEQPNDDRDSQPVDVIAGYQLPADLVLLKQKLLSADHDNYMKQKQAAHHHMSSIMNSMSTRQEHRYECWNRSVIPKNIVKSIMNNVLNQHSTSTSKKKSNVDDKSVIVMQALSKCLVMELVRKSREIQKESIAHFMGTNDNNKDNADKHQQHTSQAPADIIDPPLDLEALDTDKPEQEQQQHTQSAEGQKTIHIDGDSTEEHAKTSDKQELDVDASNARNVVQDEQKAAQKDEQDAEFLIGAIRPIHIREALRALQNDKASFFHTNTCLFGTNP